MSLYAKGKILGVATRQQVNPNTGETWDKLFLVIQSRKTGGLDGQFVDSEFLLTKRQIQQGAEKRLNELRGQEVLIEVFCKNRTSTGTDRVYTDWMLAGDAVPVRMPAAKAA
ncbi:DNA-binding protein [Spongiibacter marinus]|uniref:DNA-binding protein n=1 Tax=Spongiibacter marinus TaxID=354246 RepID=UPI00356B4519